MSAKEQAGTRKSVLLSILVKIIAMTIGVVIGKYIRDFLKSDAALKSTMGITIIKTPADPVTGKFLWIDVGDVVGMLLGGVLAVFGPKIHNLVRYVGIGITSYNISRAVMDVL